MNDSDMQSRTRPGKQPPGPAAIRHLASSTSIYRRTLDDAAAVIRGAIEDSDVMRELGYARLYQLVVAADEPLRDLEEHCRVLLGEEAT